MFDNWEEWKEAVITCFTNKGYDKSYLSLNEMKNDFETGRTAEGACEQYVADYIENHLL